MLQLKQVTLRRGKKTLLEEADLLINTGEKVGFVGSNGAGKSSLFSLLRGDLECDGGEVSLANNLAIAEIRQEIPTGKQSITDYVLTGDEALAALKKKMDDAEAKHDGMLLAELLQEYAELDGYTAESRAAKLLVGLGFQQDDLRKPVDDFSGGWRMRLNLVRVLMARADILLLDEPTNHLDLEAIVWLEKWIQNLQQTIFIISHDREFLDNTVKRVVHFDRQRLKSYGGNYSYFELQYAQALTQQSAAYENQQQKIAHLQKFVDRFGAKASKARQAKSRVKMIERMEKVAAVQATNPFNFEFREATPTTNPALTMTNANIGYPDKQVLTDVSLSIYSGDRIGLLGLNGAGKSTLVKALAGELEPEGKMSRCSKLNIGYFAQHQLESLTMDATPMWHLQQIDSKILEKTARTFLGTFNFKGERVFEPVRHFSGGEKARLALALLVWQQPNLLLLDEPSNHLDLEMREALMTALQNYEGAMILITHDRYLLKSLVDELYLVNNGSVQRFDGDMDAYQSWLMNQNQQKEKEPETVRKPKLAVIHNPVDYEKEYAKLEAQLAVVSNKLITIDTYLADAYSQGESNPVNLLQQQETLTNELVEIEKKMLAIMAKIHD